MADAESPPPSEPKSSPAGAEAGEAEAERRAEPGEAEAKPRADEARGATRARRLAVARRWAGRAAVVLPPVLIVVADVARRFERVRHYERSELVFYAFSVLLSMVFWGSLMVVAARRAGFSRWIARGLLALGATFAVGAQFYTHSRYQAYLDHRAVLVGTSMLPSIGQQLWFDRWTFLRALLPPLAIAIAWPFVLRRIAPARPLGARHAQDSATLALLFALFVSPERGAEQGTVPDVMYFSSMGQLARARWDHNETVERVHPGPRSPKPVPKVVAKPAVPRNVIFVITESVRAQSVCVEHSPDCKWTPFSNKEVPNRLPLTQMRALDSTTAISLSIMWNGLAPTETREELHAAPLVWEYMHAAGIHGAYWTSQNLLFGNSGTWLEGVPLERRTSATELEPNPTYEMGADDGKLVDFVLKDIANLPEPYFAVVHLSNTHFPYKIDPAYTPWLPQEEATGPGYETEILNRYQDSIYLQDVALGRLFAGLKKRPEAGRTVTVFVSDHGEQMREKGAVGHTGTLFDVEIRVPFWVDAPRGTLTEGEEKSLASLRKTPVTNLDIFPTLMDLVGLYGAPELAPLQAKVAGKSLLRGGTDPERPIVLTNCTELWACAFKNWGAMKGTKKLIAHEGDHAWNCYDVADDPDERKNLGEAACPAELKELAERTGNGRPWAPWKKGLATAGR